MPRSMHAQGEMSGEPTVDSIILQSRLTAADTLADGEVPGDDGEACFEVAVSPDFSDSFRTPWMRALPDHDHIVKVKVGSLAAGTKYHYRLLRRVGDVVYRGDTCSFSTLPDPGSDGEISFVVVTGMNYAFFHHGRDGHGAKMYTGPDKHLGYPGLEAMLGMEPDFFIGTGDNVYYDHPASTRVKTVPEMRRKWHEQFVQERYRRFFASVPCFWEKDDHDYRYNDADPSDIPQGAKPRDDIGMPTHVEGVRVFREQVPVVDPGDPGAVTYRTRRIGRLLQLWFVEGRDYRDPNTMPDGPDKSLWGDRQREWLKRILLESDAVFRILVSPTPMVGPDDAYKVDNHVNHDGFRTEGDAFFRWLGDNGFLDRNFYIVCGDRHWQYHSIHPSGFEEFSCGALVDANARLGRLPGDPDSTDPDALIRQPYTQSESSGGFLRVTVRPDGVDGAPEAEFSFHDEHGARLYSCIRAAR